MCFLIGRVSPVPKCAGARVGGGGADRQLLLSLVREPSASATAGQGVCLNPHLKLFSH